MSQDCDGTQPPALAVIRQADGWLIRGTSESRSDTVVPGHIIHAGARLKCLSHRLPMRMTLILRDLHSFSRKGCALSAACVAKVARRGIETYCVMRRSTFYWILTEQRFGRVRDAIESVPGKA